MPTRTWLPNNQTKGVAMSQQQNAESARKPKSVNLAKYRRMNVDQLKSELQTFPAYLKEKEAERDAKIAEAKRVHEDRVKFCNQEIQAIKGLIDEKLAPPKPKPEKAKAAPKSKAKDEPAPAPVLKAVSSTAAKSPTATA